MIGGLKSKLKKFEVESAEVSVIVDEVVLSERVLIPRDVDVIPVTLWTVISAAQANDLLASKRMTIANR